MQLNPGSSLGIVDDIDFLCGTDSTSYPTADKVRNINRHYYVAVSDILKSSHRWNFDDSNQADLPIVTADLVDAQQDYTLPATALKIHAVEIKDADGNYKRLKEIDKFSREGELNQTITDYRETDGLPEYYDFDGQSIYLFPAPASADVTISDGLKLYISREVDAFTSADTTQEPGFAEAYHRILSFGAAYDWLLVNDDSGKADRIQQNYEAMRKELREFYGNRNTDVKTRLRPVHRTNSYF